MLLPVILDFFALLLATIILTILLSIIVTLQLISKEAEAITLPLGQFTVIWSCACAGQGGMAVPG